MSRSLWWYRFWIAWGFVFAALNLGWTVRGASVLFNRSIAGLHLIMSAINVEMFRREKVKNER